MELRKIEMPEIETQRCLLRKIEETDSDVIFPLLSDPEVIENLNMKLHTQIKDTEELIKNYLVEYEKGCYFPYVVTDKQTKEFLGVFLLKLDLYDEDCFEFTIYLKKEVWGKGIYTEILPYMTQFVFENIKVENFRGFVKEKNKASSKVLKKCGFELEKVFDVPGIEGKIESYLRKKK